MKRSDTPKPLPKHRRDMKRSDTPKPLLKTLNPELTFGTGSYYKPVPKLLWPAHSPGRPRGGPFNTGSQGTGTKGGAFVPGLLYRFLNRYKRPSQTGIHERFS